MSYLPDFKTCQGQIILYHVLFAHEQRADADDDLRQWISQNNMWWLILDDSSSPERSLLILFDLWAEAEEDGMESQSKCYGLLARAS